MDFSFYDPVNVNRIAPKDTTGAVTVRCVRGFLVWVTLGEGAHAAAGSTCITPQRRLAVTVNGTTDYLRYELYRDPAHTAVWGCDESNAQNYISAGPNAPTTLTVYGRIPGGQDPLVNWYVDNVEVTVWF
jgi:spore coat protein U-like protein